MTETEFLDRKLEEIKDDAINEHTLRIRNLDTDAREAGAVGGSRHQLLIHEAINDRFSQTIVIMARFALQHCAKNGQPKQLAKDALKKAGDSLSSALLHDYEARIFASAAFPGGHGPSAQERMVSERKSEMEETLDSALLDAERGYAGTEQMFKEVGNWQRVRNLVHDWGKEIVIGLIVAGIAAAFFT